MTTKTLDNQAMEDLQNAVIRQAESLGMNPGDDEFEVFVMDRIVKPELRMMKAVRGPSHKSIRTDVFIDGIDTKWVHQRLLKSMAHWCKLNKGMYMSNAARILGYDERRIKTLGEQHEQAGLGSDFSKLLDGSDDRIDSAFIPDTLSDGGSRTSTHRGGQ